MDNYLGRMLKNWAASSQPHPNGREQLLAMAAGAQLSERRKSKPDFLRSLMSTSNYHGFHEAILSQSFSQSTIWSFQLVVSNRLLA